MRGEGQISTVIAAVVVVVVTALSTVTVMVFETSRVKYISMRPFGSLSAYCPLHGPGEAWRWKGILIWRQENCSV